MTSLKFELDIDAEIQKLGLPPAKVAKPANPCSEKNELFSESRRYTKLINSIASIDPEDIELKFEIEERMAIMEIDGGLPKEEAERMAFERVIGLLVNNEFESLNDRSLSQIKLLVEARSIFNGAIL
jgi:hypothetical protein